MKYLVDANVLSEPTRPAPDSGVVEWLRRNEREIVVDPVILGEIRFGILLLHKGKRRASLERWFDVGVQRSRSVLFFAVFMIVAMWIFPEAGGNKKAPKD